MIFFLYIYIIYVILCMMCERYYADERISAIRKCFSWIWILSDRVAADRLPSKYTPVHTTYSPEDRRTLMVIRDGWPNIKISVSISILPHGYLNYKKFTFRHTYKSIKRPDRFDIYISFETRIKSTTRISNKKKLPKEDDFSLNTIYLSLSSIRFEDIFPFFPVRRFIIISFSNTILHRAELSVDIRGLCSLLFEFFFHSSI